VALHLDLVRIGDGETAEQDGAPLRVDELVALSSWHELSAIDGKCVDLEGFHDGEVSLNVCLDLAGFGIVMNNSNPDMESRNVRIEDNLLDGVKYGGIFVIGAGNAICRNRLLNLNAAHCGCYYTAGEPDLFASGIYLGKGAERPAPAHGNRIEENEITGYRKGPSLHWCRARH
jgi:hypothetical protein